MSLCHGSFMPMAPKASWWPVGSASSPGHGFAGDGLELSITITALCFHKPAWQKGFVPRGEEVIGEDISPGHLGAHASRPSPSPSPPGGMELGAKEVNNSASSPV